MARSPHEAVQLANWPERESPCRHSRPNLTNTLACQEKAQRKLLTLPCSAPQNKGVGSSAHAPTCRPMVCLCVEWTVSVQCSTILLKPSHHHIVATLVLSGTMWS